MKDPFPAVRCPPTCLERHGHHKQHSIPWPMAAGHRDMSRDRHVLACGLFSLLGSGRGTSLVLNCLFPDYKDPRLGQNQAPGLPKSVAQMAQLLAFAQSQYNLPSSHGAPKIPPHQGWWCASKALPLASGTVEEEELLSRERSLLNLLSNLSVSFGTVGLCEPCV